MNLSYDYNVSVSKLNAVVGETNLVRIFHNWSYTFSVKKIITPILTCY